MNLPDSQELTLLLSERDYDAGGLRFWIFGLLNLFRISDLEKSNLNRADGNPRCPASRLVARMSPGGEGWLRADLC